MVTLQDIEEVLSTDNPMVGFVSLSSIVTLGKFTDVDLKMDDKSFDYYYSLSVPKLMESRATKECLTDLAKDGWTLTKDKEHIIKYLKTFA